MSYFSRFDDQAPALHQGALDDLVEKARQKGFILLQLALSLAACALAPFYLAFHGAPALWQTLAFICAMAPLAGVALIWRTGQLWIAQILSSLSVIAVAAILVIGGGSSLQSALCLLILAPLQAILTGDRRLIIASGMAAAGAAIALAIIAGPADAHVAVAALFVLPAIAYALAAALNAARIGTLQSNAATLHASRYRAISEAVGDLVICFDTAANADYISVDCESRLGLRRVDLSGRGFFEHIHVGDRPSFLKAIADAAHSAERGEVTLRLRTPANPGTDEAHATPVFLWIEMQLRQFSASGNGLAIAAILRDVTKAKRREEDLEAARAASERLNQSRDQFLANMSHELRTPLNAIIGFSEMLSSRALAPQDPAKQREYAEIIRESGLHLLSVVNSILDMSKLQSGSFMLMPEAFDLAPLVDLCCDMTKLKASENGVELIRAYSPKIPEMVGDKQACKQIVINLLSNAIKFTPAKGRVTIGVKPEGNSLIIRVSDTGIGINAQDLAQIGDPFFQASASYNRAYDGTGLGLSIVRGLVALHGGTIAIESEPGKGTSVSVRLPRDCRHARMKPVSEFTTIPRRTRADDMRAFSNDMMVKKIA